MQVRSVRKTDVSSLAEFIARLQRNSSHHIGYVSEHPEDIAKDLHEMDGLEEQFFCAEDHTGIRGFLGMDLDDNEAWIYGPMCDAKNWNTTVNALWTKLEPKLFEKKLLLFCDIQNTRLAKFALEIGCLEHGHEFVLRFARSELQNLGARVVNVREITEQDFPAFTTLHDSIFPGTYYSGTQILERLNDRRKLFVCGESDLLGYSYAEVSDNAEASLEFIGVEQHARGQGIGHDVMLRTLEWVFSFGNLKQVSLTVNANNTVALAMYQKLGFLGVRRMVSYCKHSSQD